MVKRKVKKVAKRGKRLTREQKEIVSGHNMNPRDWMFVEESSFYITVCRKDNPDIKKMLDKFKKMTRR